MLLGILRVAWSKIFLSVLLVGKLSALAAPPAWWQERGVTSGTLAADDFGLINQGQLKKFALAAFLEMELRLPGGAGPDVTALINTWTTVDAFNNRIAKSGGATDNYATVNLGQLKAVAKVYYDRLIELGFRKVYPWTNLPSDNYLFANIGQAKALFSFDLTKAAPNVDANQNNIPDWWELKYVRSLFANLDEDSDGDGVSNRREYLNGTDPTDYFNGKVPVLSLDSGDGQVGKPGEWTALPLTVLIRNSANVALGNAPVTFTLTSSQGGGLASSRASGALVASKISVRTDSSGRASAYFIYPSSSGVVSSMAGKAGSLGFSARSSAPLSAPTFVSAIPGKGSVTISWNPVPGATSYRVKRSTTPGQGYSDFAGNTVNGTTALIDASVINGKRYYYIVYASDGFQLGGPSSEVNGFPRATVVTPRVIASKNQSLAIMPDKTLWRWGNSMRTYFVASSSSLDLLYPQAIPGMENVIDAACSDDHWLAIKEDGTIWGAGVDGHGQLCAGPGGKYVDVPIQVIIPGNSSPAVSVACGDFFSVAALADGSVWAWGKNDGSQLGIGPSTSATRAVMTPTRVRTSASDTLNNIVSVSACKTVTIALRSDGTCWSWGFRSGQYGTGILGRPVGAAGQPGATGYAGQVTDASNAGPFLNVSKVSSGGTYVMLLKTDGSVWGWGDNSDGQLGNGLKFFVDGSKTKVRVGCPAAGPYLQNIVSIACGDTHTAVVKSDGTLLTWGTGDHGQLGNGTLIPSSSPVTSPVTVTALPNTVSVACGSHTLAVKSNGSIYSFGYNLRGQLGVGTFAQNASPAMVLAFPVRPVLNFDGGKSLASQLATVSYADLSAGIRYTIDGSEPTTASPLISNGGSIQFSASTVFRAKAFSQDGNVTADSGIKGALYSIGSQLMSGWDHSLALEPAGSLWSWGSNASGQLGIGQQGGATNQSSPVRVSTLRGVIAAAAGQSHSIAVQSDGRVFTWGSNSSSQLGERGVGADNNPTPFPLSASTLLGNLKGDLYGAIGVAAGAAHTLVLKPDGTVWSFGSNSAGQLGGQWWDAE